VFDAAGRPVLATGSPVGSRIISYVAQNIVASLDWNLPMADALALPHYMNRNGGLELEEDRFGPDMADAMRARGYEVKTAAMNSGLHVIRVHPDGRLEGGADPRREGMAMGEGNMLPDMDAAFRLVLP